MALGTIGNEIGEAEHAVQFYAHDAELAVAVGPYLAAAVRAGETAIVIATEAHRRAFAAQLAAAQTHGAPTTPGGTVTWLDAAGTLATLMRDGAVDRGAFARVIGGHVREALRCSRGVRAYGEMVALLWDAGNVLGALELERVWNELARELPFSLLCAYRTASVADPQHADPLRQVCDLHGSVLHRFADGAPARPHEPPQADVSAIFPAEHHAPGRARRLVAARLRQWGHSETVVQDAALIVSELAANAVLHGGSRFSVAIRMREQVLRVAVTDEDATPLAAARVAQELHARRAPGAPPPLTSRRERGLGVVDALTNNWGVEGAASGKTVWAELRP